MSSFLRTRVISLAVATLVVAGLWLVLWRAYPPYAHGHFDRTESYAARWPDVVPFNLPAVDAPAFYDLQVILWGIEVAAEGRDPYHEPPPAGTPYWYNYPRIWLHLAPPGLNLEATRPLGLALAAVFLGSALVVVRPRTAMAVAWLAALLFSPPTLDALAYANNDLIVFTLLAMAALGWSTRPSARRWLSLGLVALAALLKLYPICALLAFLDGRRRTLVAACVVGGALALFFVFQLEELRTISSQTPRPHYRAIGSQVLTSRLLDGATRHPATLARLESLASLPTWQRVLPPATTATLLVLLGVCMRAGFRRGRLQPPPGTEPELAHVHRMAFRLGACVHLAAFVIGHNYMHREILLILTGPWLLAAADRRWLAWLIVPIAGLAGVPMGLGFLAVQLATWVLTAGLAYWLARDLAGDLTASLQPSRATIG